METSVIIALLVSYVVGGLLLTHSVLLKISLHSKSKENFRVVKYCQNLFPLHALINALGKLFKNLGELILSIVTLLWEMSSNVFDVLFYLFAWPVILIKVNKNVKSYEAGKNNG